MIEESSRGADPGADSGADSGSASGPHSTAHAADKVATESDAQFAELFRRFLTQVVHRAPASGSVRTPLGDRISRHLGVDARTLAMVEESFAPHRIADLDAGFAALGVAERALGAAEGELIGVSGGQQKRFVGLPDLIVSDAIAFAEAPVDYVSADVGPGEQRNVVAFGVRLLTVDGAPVAVLQRAADPQHGRVQASVEVLAAEQSTSSTLIDRLRSAMNEHSVLRGQVISFSESSFDYGNGTLTFLPRPVVLAESIVLPPGALDRVRSHVIGIREHAQRIREGGGHLKRGVLLYGPPGTGKTLTVSHLISEAAGITTVVLTGQAIRFISEATQLARAMQPSMVVLEDVDLIAGDREMFGGPQPLLFAVLDALDGFEGDADVAFVLTTNRVDLLERALVERPGRVDLAVEIPRPDRDARRRLFALYTARAPFSPAAVAAVADESEGVTGSFAKELVRRALLRAATADRAVDDADLFAVSHELRHDRESLTRRLVGGAPSPDDAEDLERQSSEPGPSLP